jgi:hypothetical protein
MSALKILKQKRELLEWGVNLRRGLNLPKGEHDHELKTINLLLKLHNDNKVVTKTNGSC